MHIWIFHLVYISYARIIHVWLLLYIAIHCSGNGHMINIRIDKLLLLLYHIHHCWLILRLPHIINHITLLLLLLNIHDWLLLVLALIRCHLLHWLHFVSKLIKLNLLLRLLLSWRYHWIIVRHANMLDRCLWIMICSPKFILFSWIVIALYVHIIINVCIIIAHIWIATEFSKAGILLCMSCSCLISHFLIKYIFLIFWIYNFYLFTQPNPYFKFFQ